MTMEQLAVRPRRKTRNGGDSQVAIAAEEIIVGKDVLELVSSAMYVDPLTVYREYVQNAADSIDEARRTGIVGKKASGPVEILFDEAARSVRIRDHGTGLPWTDFSRRLTALGASPKRGGVSRGFRGVGRLAGLGYAQQLVFRSRVLGEKSVSELTWDCRGLRAALRDGGSDDGVAELISRLVDVRRIGTDGYPERFFEVELKGVVRLRNDRLMSPPAVSEYLSQVAPVPFAPDFPFADEIRAALGDSADLCDLEIRLSGSEAPLYRPHRSGFSDNDKQMRFERCEIIRIPDVDGGVGAVGWLIHHDYEGAVPAATRFKGLRLRSGNVQIGGGALLEELFSEPRFNSWTIGEIHVFDRRIVPNARRDDFEQNVHYSNLLNQLTPVARSVSKLCRTSSKRRQLLRDFEAQRQMVEDRVSILRQGSVRSAGRKTQLAAVEQALTRMAKLICAEELSEVRSKLTSDVEKLRGRVHGVAKEADRSPLAALPPKKRAMYGHMFELIYDCSTNRAAAKALVDRIIETLVTRMPVETTASGARKRSAGISRRSTARR